MRFILLVVVLSLLAIVESVDTRRKTGTPEEMQEAQKARRMEGTFPTDIQKNGMPPPPGFGPPDFNRGSNNDPAGVNGFPPGFNPGQPGFHGEGANGVMNGQGMNDQGRTGPMFGRNGMPPPGFNGQQGGPNGMPPPPPGFDGQQGGPNGMTPPPGFNGQQGGPNGMFPPPPGFNGQQGGPPGMFDANGAPIDPRGIMNGQGMNDQGRTGPMYGRNGMLPPGFNGQQGGPNGMTSPPGFNGQQGGPNGMTPPPPGFNGQQGGPPGMFDANGAPIDPRLRAHEQMKQQVRQRSNAYLQRMDTLPNLSEDVKSTMRQDIEELYKVEAGIYEQRNPVVIAE